ncbi:hypothetical protein [Candidatus Corynebacterium faecigallinarum]|uniref:hypothetical protein n=1 Tax=Candidatus Corynebacterium faecigallinarum TaxID=2838528 RepID=UPI003FD5076B
MKRTPRRTATAVAIGALTLALAACGNDDTPEQTPATATETQADPSRVQELVDEFGSDYGDGQTELCTEIGDVHNDEGECVPYTDLVTTPTRPSDEVTIDDFRSSYPTPDNEPAPDPAPAPAPNPPAGTGGGGQQLEWRTMGPYGGLMGCDGARDQQPIQTSDCYQGDDGHYYFDSRVQSPR